MRTQSQCVFLIVVLTSIVPVFAQTNSAEPVVASFTGEVSGNDVYVRSGPSTNFYAVSKLDAGERVEVLEEENGWLAIAPPAGSFSLIHKNYVDLQEGDRQGVVNGDSVIVRAGTAMSPDLYAKQLKLDRGEEVTVLRAHNEDYLRIVPPRGVRLYIHSQYVERVPESLLGASGSASVAPSSEGASPELSESKASLALEEPEKKVTPQPGLHATKIAELDAAVAALASVPLVQRDHASLIEDYRVLVEQEADMFARGHARARIAQLEDAQERASAVRLVRSLAEDVATTRKESLMMRNEIRPPAREIGGGFDVVGRLRRSMIYGSGVFPQRYRLVSDDASPPRTIGYVEIAEGAKIDIDRFLGRLVGVRASRRTLQTGDVDPVIIYQARELALLDVAESPQVDSGDGPGAGDDR